ncbi:hypothetical protein NH673_16830 [Pseudomonas putida]|uniref:hypothetical protein n=1 Tax=Pseudomonas putida TaxID=303 RepID=UPI0006B45971|nr:hypothetical protein [Pseudomonas putida]USX34863.1 hypothetical protein NH673_16830 [Pseudomonas putida]
MGQQKHAMMKADDQHAAALGIARRAKVLDYCGNHDVHSHDGGDIQPAYMLGNSMFSSGELDGIFDDRREMTDAIKAAVDSCMPECYSCQRNKDD